MADIRFTGSGKLNLPGYKYDALPAGETVTVTSDVAEELSEREDVERVNDDSA